MNMIFRVLGFTINIIIMYLIGSFIAWNINPSNWLLFTTSIGRIISLLLLFINFYANFVDKN